MANEVAIKVVAVDDTKGFAQSRNEVKSFSADTKAEMAKTGREAGEELSRGIVNGLGDMQSKLKGKVSAKSLLPEPGELASQAAEAGVTLGEGIGKTMTSGIMAAAKNPYILAGLGIGAAAASTIIAASISAAIIGAAGAGGVIGGIMLVKDDPRIATAGTAMADNLLNGFKQKAGVFVQPVLQSLGMIQDRVNAMGEDIGSAFSSASRYVVPFTDALLRATEAIVSGIVPAIENAGPVMAAIGEAIVMIAEEIGEGFRELSNNSTEAGMAILDLASGISIAIEVMFEFVEAMTTAYGYLRAYSAFITGDFAGAASLLAQMQLDGKNKTEDLGGAYKGTSDDLANFIDKQNEANDAIYEGTNVARDAITAQIDYRKAVKDATDAVDYKNDVSDDEMMALIGVAEKTDRLTTAIRTNNGSAQEMSKAIQAGKDDIIRLGQAMGMSEKDAIDLANKLIAVPDDINVRVDVNTANAMTKTQQIKNLVNSIQDKRVDITVVESIYRQDAALANRVNNRAAGGPIGAAATGGARGALTWVGEQGPELLRLPYGSQVYPAGQSKQMAAQQAQQAGGGAPVVNLYASGGILAERDVVRIIRDELSRGGFRGLVAAA